MQTVERFVLTFLVNSLWQTTLVVAIAACCVRLMRNTEARYRHFVWVAALVLGLILPVMSPGRIGQREPASRESADRVQVRSSVPKESGRVMEPGTQAFNPAGSTTGATRPGSGRLRSSWFSRALGRVREPVSLPVLLVSIVLACYFVWILIQSFRLARALKTTSETRRSAENRLLPQWMTPIVSRCQGAFRLRGVRILYSSRAVGPLTVGVRRPVIILPESLFEASTADDLTAALCHEMAHIRRRDFTLNLVYELLYLPVSFHPAARLARRRIGETRELACDEMAMGRVLDAPAYARSLLSIALKMSRLPSPAIAAGPGYTLGIFDTDILQERIMKLLNRTPRVSRRIAKASLGLALIVLMAASLGAAAFSLGVNYKEQSAPKPPAESFALQLRRELARGLPLPSYMLDRLRKFLNGYNSDERSSNTNTLVAANDLLPKEAGDQRDAADQKIAVRVPRNSVAEAVGAGDQQEQTGSVSGTVFDPSGARVPCATVKITNGDTGKEWRTATDETGEFSFTAVAFGKYKLEVEKPGFKISRDNEVAIDPDKSSGRLDVTLSIGEVVMTVMVVGAKTPEGIQQQTHNKSRPQRIRVGGLVETMKLVKQPKPDYPESVRQKKIQGTVLLRAVISKEGVPIDWKVLSSPDPALSRAAVDAFKEWRSGAPQR